MTAKPAPDKRRNGQGTFRSPTLFRYGSYGVPTVKEPAP